VLSNYCFNSPFLINSNLSWFLLSVFFFREFILLKNSFDVLQIHFFFDIDEILVLRLKFTFFFCLDKVLLSYNCADTLVDVSVDSLVGEIFLLELFDIPSFEFRHLTDIVDFFDLLVSLFDPVGGVV